MTDEEHQLATAALHQADDIAQRIRAVQEVLSALDLCGCDYDTMIADLDALHGILAYLSRIPEEPVPYA